MTYSCDVTRVALPLHASPEASTFTACSAVCSAMAACSPRRISASAAFSSCTVPGRTGEFASIFGAGYEDPAVFIPVLGWLIAMDAALFWVKKWFWGCVKGDGWGGVAAGVIVGVEAGS